MMGKDGPVVCVGVGAGGLLDFSGGYLTLLAVC